MIFGKVEINQIYQKKRLYCQKMVVGRFLKTKLRATVSVIQMNGLILASQWVFM